jgi:hypothetical protein
MSSNFQKAINFYPILCASMPRRLAPPPICKLKVFWLVLRLHVHADSSKLLSSPARNQIRAYCEMHHGVAFYSSTLISGTKGVKNGVRGCPKRYLLHRVDHVTVSRFFLAYAVKRPKRSQAQNSFPRLTRPVFSKMAAYTAYYMDRFNRE